MPNMNRINAVFQKLLSGHKILITDERTHERTHARTGVTLNAPPPFFEWRGHKKIIDIGIAYRCNVIGRTATQSMSCVIVNHHSLVYKW